MTAKDRATYARLRRTERQLQRALTRVFVQWRDGIPLVRLEAAIAQRDNWALHDLVTPLERQLAVVATGTIERTFRAGVRSGQEALWQRRRRA